MASTADKLWGGMEDETPQASSGVGSGEGLQGWEWEETEEPCPPQNTK